MWIRLRQIAVVTSDLLKTSLDVQTVLGVEACHTDPGVGVFGLKNTLWPIGNQFLECVTPVKDGTAGGRYIQRRGGDSGYMVINQVDDVAARITHVEDIDVRIANHMEYDKANFEGIQLHPADTGGSFFEMDQMKTADAEDLGGSWWPAGSDWSSFSRTERVAGISAAELQAPDPERLAGRWAQIAQLDVIVGDSGNPTIVFDNATIRFVEAIDGRGEGLGGIDLICNDREAVLEGARQRDCVISDDEVSLGGLRVYLRD
ncbi:MAG: hypothetical protein CMA21_05840 [Euryarchaeota archaeon]|nr:hypothetical protein [Euryarchaeota archaeon]OUW32724.1 MAG: hypothetical protein CBD32_05225 [Actinobacteria bacterium TMED172]|tara:strand:- start:266 stop:1045 length:780 start_codon:yes stop_codon:yes gene_type:complete